MRRIETQQQQIQLDNQRKTEILQNMWNEAAEEKLQMDLEKENMKQRKQKMAQRRRTLTALSSETEQQTALSSEMEQQTALSPETDQQKPPDWERCEGCDPKGRGDAHSQADYKVACTYNRGCLLHKDASALRGPIVFKGSGVNSLFIRYDDDVPFLIRREGGDLCLESKYISRQLKCVLWRKGSQLSFCVQAGWNENILVGGKQVEEKERKQVDLDTTIYFGRGCEYTLCQACPDCEYESEGLSQAMAAREAIGKVQHVQNLSCQYHTPQETRLSTKRQRSDDSIRL